MDDPAIRRSIGFPVIVHHGKIFNKRYSRPTPPRKLLVVSNMRRVPAILRNQKVVLFFSNSLPMLEIVPPVKAMA